MKTNTMTSLIAGAALCGASAGAANATVIYNWQSTGAGQYAHATGGQIQVTDDAYSVGSLSFDTDTAEADTTTFNFPDSPILESGLTFDYFDPGGGISGVGAFLDPTVEGFTSDGTSLSADLAFNTDGTLSGSFDIFAESDNFDSSGMGASWKVSDVNSDFFENVCHETSDTPPCSGGTGFWQLDPATVPDGGGSTEVPAPGSWGLFGLAIAGIFGLFGARKQRSAGHDSAVV